MAELEGMSNDWYTRDLLLLVELVQRNGTNWVIKINTLIIMIIYLLFNTIERISVPFSNNLVLNPVL